MSILLLCARIFKQFAGTSITRNNAKGCPCNKMTMRLITFPYFKNDLLAFMHALQYNYLWRNRCPTAYFREILQIAILVDPSMHIHAPRMFWNSSVRKLDASKCRPAGRQFIRQRKSPTHHSRPARRVQELDASSWTAAGSLHQCVLSSHKKIGKIKKWE